MGLDGCEEQGVVVDPSTLLLQVRLAEGPHPAQQGLAAQVLIVAAGGMGREGKLGYWTWTDRDTMNTTMWRIVS